jgi:hypothetical protein
MIRNYFLTVLLSAAFISAQTATPAKPKPEDTEVWEPVPKVVTPGANNTAPPSDAIVLFDGKNLDEWVSTRDKGPAKWTVSDGVLTVNKAKGLAGSIETKRNVPELPAARRVADSGEHHRQRPGVAATAACFSPPPGPGDSGYELQVLDSYNNPTYVNGQAGSIYKQGIPLANPNRKPGEWQTYDVVWTAPTFNSDGSLKTPAFVTVFFNGVLVQNHFELKGETRYIGRPVYKPYDTAAIKLQGHPDPSEPVSFRNIWVRPLN